MRSRWNLPIYLGFVAISLLVMSVIVGNLHLTYPWSNPFRLVATFATGDGILVNNEVYMNGTKVGKVAELTPVDAHARVVMEIDDSQALPIYRDATAEIRKKNLLGETYVELSRGDAASGSLGSGDAIPLSQTLQTVQIDQVLAILDPQTRQRLQLLINGGGDALANRGADMNREAHSLEQLTTALNGPAAVLQTRREQLAAIVVELEKLYTVLARQRDQVRDEFITWNQVTAQLAAQEEAIKGTVVQADHLLSSLDALVTGEVGNLRATLQELAPALQTTNGFLDQTNDILGTLAPYRRSIHDVFPNLGTSFQDVTSSGQHLWSVYSLSDCNTGCQAPSPAAAHVVAPNAVWAAVMGGAG